MSEWFTDRVICTWLMFPMKKFQGRSRETGLQLLKCTDPKHSVPFSLSIYETTGNVIPNGLLIRQENYTWLMSALDNSRGPLVRGIIFEK
ncbi:hypothetical protein NPIL_201191 [Nephila pilipes]|uniref:Uncharacterized protein n=1 Tax=Nephila pilipes TaxID=299642 RepID=A0A8X6NHE4_NEPPI|nr:hypothetical protein NPIL_201191 [Nephila pilipes]